MPLSPVGLSLETAARLIKASIDSAIWAKDHESGLVALPP
jgi:hypothetical protein